jgi:hypothetical protein
MISALTERAAVNIATQILSQRITIESYNDLVTYQLRLIFRADNVQFADATVDMSREWDGQVSIEQVGRLIADIILGILKREDPQKRIGHDR